MITTHQPQYFLQLLYHHLTDPLGDLLAHNPTLYSTTM